jgi:hypothetical protein
MQIIRVSVPLAACLLLSFSTLPAAAQSADMTFFIASAGPGKGGDLGGLAGADAHCQQLAAVVGAGGKTWRAYFSTQGDGAVNARDRIGSGPWQNAKGTVVATSVADLHSDNNKLSKQNSLSEKGDVINGGGDSPNRHDILTGSQADGTAFPTGEDRTCSNWTSSTKGMAMLGHHDRSGLRDDAPSKSWNSSHSSRESRDGSAPGQGCSQKALQGTGGDGLFYCFAAN